MGQMDKIPSYRLKNDSWTWKRTGFYGENSTFNAITGITVLSVLLSCVGVVEELDPKITATFILTAISGILWDDPLDIVSHFLARTIRKLFAAVSIMCLSAIWINSENYLMLVMAISFLIIPAGFLVNKRMMLSDSWKYSASVQHGLTMASNSDTEKAWQAWGSAECRALYGYSGNDVDDQLISRYAKPVFFLVYHKIRDKFIDRLEENERMRMELYEASDRIERLESELEASEQNIYELMNREDDSGLYMHLKEDRDNIAMKCAQLQLANDELLEALNAKEVETETVNVPDDRYLYLSPEERVKELLLRGKSYREIEEITGISKTKVGKIKKEMENEYE